METVNPPASSFRKTAFVAGALYLVTIFASIPALFLKGPVLNERGYVLGPGQDTLVLWGGVLDLVTALACIGTAVVLFPVVKRQNEAAALGFVAARVLEAALIVVGVVAVLSVVALRQDPAGMEPGALTAVGAGLVAVHDWTFLLGPGVIPVINALLLGSLLYRGHLVPRPIPVMGFIGAAMLLASSAATLFGLNEQVSAWSAVAGLPIFLWEFSLGVWLVVKGFRTAGLATAAPTMVR
jgi:hypothetical protein